MNGNILADTSLLINFFNGNSTAKKFLIEADIWISGITEIELLSSSNITSTEKRLLKDFLKNTIIIDLLPAIKEIAVDLRISKTLKLPDAIIAATAIHKNFPLITYDKAFGKVPELNLVLIEL